MSPVPDFGGLPPYANFDDVTIKVNDLVQRLRQLLLNLDTLNIRSLNAKVIEAGTITADKMNVNELSAISANLGHITAGLIESVEIYGSYIATRYNSYPRAELDSTENLFGAYASLIILFRYSRQLVGSLLQSSLKHHQELHIFRMILMLMHLQ